LTVRSLFKLSRHIVDFTPTGKSRLTVSKQSSVLCRIETCCWRN